MRRPQSVMDGPRSEAKNKRQKKRGDSAGVRRAVFSDVPKDEVESYTERLRELATQQARLEREFQQRSTANRRAIRKMHDENTHLRTIRAGTSDVTAVELEQLEQCKFIELRRLNRLTHQLEKLEEKFRENEMARRLKEEADKTPPLEAVTGNRSVVLRIQKLEKQLDKMLTEQQCVRSIRSMYEKVLEELREEWAGRESSVAVLEHDIESRRREYAKLVLMYKNSTTDHQIAKETLQKFKDKFEEGRRMKDKALGDRRLRVERALKETHYLEVQEVKLQNDIETEHQRIEEAETLHKERIRRRQRSVSAMERISMVQQESQQQGDGSDDRLQTIGGTPEDEERVRAYEESLRKMMRATESSTIDELMTKFELEYAARLQLQDQVREEKAKLERLSAVVRRLREETRHAKLCGVGRPPVTSGLRDEVVKCIEEATVKREEAVQGTAELQQLLAELTRRVDVLADIVANYRPEVSVPLTTVENYITNMRIVMKKIFSLADEAISRDHAPVKMDSMLVVVPPSNTRIALPPPGTTGAAWRESSHAVDNSAASEQEMGSSVILPFGETTDVKASFSPSTVSDEEVVKDAEGSMTLLDNEDPLTREQIKRLATVVLRREARRRQLEKRRR
ncbi:hypothetical protein BCY84_05366 [Trypanosoma cruzi cruzi]|nr:hypothetical protein BCY84_05366 [Trypanosoma cruzi cruzi]